MSEAGFNMEQVTEFVLEAFEGVCMRDSISHAETECILHGKKIAVMVMPADIAEAVRAALLDIMATRRN